MRHSLLSRFQGTLLAAALGDELETYCRLEQPYRKEGIREGGQGVTATSALTGWHPGLGSRLRASTPTPWGEAAVKCARALVHAGRWHEPAIAAIEVRLTAALSARTVLVQPHSHEALSTARGAIAALPLMLFFHDDESKQQPFLSQTVKLWQYPPGAEAGLLAVGYAIAQVLKERLNRLTLVPQTIAYLKRSTANPTATLLNLMEALEQVQPLICQNAGLYAAIDLLRAVTHPDNEALALAFYCFLSTPDDLRLSLLRAARCGGAASSVAALTGALSGAHNSLRGLPLAWRTDSPLLLLWNLSTVELNQLAAQLFAVWSGLYNPIAPMPPLAIAAPGIIRPR